MHFFVLFAIICHVYNIYTTPCSFIYNRNTFLLRVNATSTILVVLPLNDRAHRIYQVRNITPYLSIIPVLSYRNYHTGSITSDISHWIQTWFQTAIYPLLTVKYWIIVLRRHRLKPSTRLRYYKHVHNISFVMNFVMYPLLFIDALMIKNVSMYGLFYQETHGQSTKTTMK